jgi:cysteine-rich repeat protein
MPSYNLSAIWIKVPLISTFVLQGLAPIGGKIKIVSRFRSYKIGISKQKRASFPFLITGFTGGTLKYDPVTCRFDKTGCTQDGDGNGDGPKPAVCGNGVPEPGEECEDGNTVSGDGCSATCQKETNVEMVKLTQAKIVMVILLLTRAAKPKDLSMVRMSLRV